jgi:ribosome maturation factor RimP
MSTALESKNLQTQLWNLLEPTIKSEGLELWDLQFSGKANGGGNVAIFVDTPEGGIQLEQCAEVSRKLSLVLDMEDPLPGAFNLEVSSPGLDRVLRRTEHFNRYIGQKVRVRLYDPLDGRRSFKGVLSQVNDASIILTVDGKNDVCIELELVKKANLIAEFSFRNDAKEQK